MICSPSRDSLETRREQIANAARRFLTILRRNRAKPKELDPATAIVIERTRERLNQIHRVGQRYLPEAPHQILDHPIIPIRRHDDGPAR